MESEIELLYVHTCTYVCMYASVVAYQCYADPRNLVRDETLLEPGLRKFVSREVHEHMVVGAPQACAVHSSVFMTGLILM